MLATDRVGLQMLTSYWKRPGSKSDDILHNEMGMTKMILDHGYNVASLQLFWRSHDFRDTNRTQRKCAVLRRHALYDTNGLVSCPGCHWNETDLNPLEVLFVHRSLSYDKARGFEVGATRAYSEQRDELDLLDDSHHSVVALSGEATCQVACPL